MKSFQSLDAILNFGVKRQKSPSVIERKQGILSAEVSDSYELARYSPQQGMWYTIISVQTSESIIRQPIIPNKKQKGEEGRENNLPFGICND